MVLDKEKEKEKEKEKTGVKYAQELMHKDDAYLAELLSYSTERLSKEPELLHDDLGRIQRQLQETAFKNHKAFVTTAECIKKVGEGFAEIHEDVAAIEQDIAPLDKSCSKYEGFLTEHAKQQQRNKQLLLNCGPLLDVLEVTQLMETCIRNGNYDEALDLEAFINKMTVLHSSVSIVQMLKEEANQLSQTMLSQLLDRLRGSLQLPECLRIIGYLRRMGTFTESGLRQEFIECRDTWFQSMIDELSQKDHYNYMKRLTDCYRVHMFDIIMQYRAIFSEEALKDHESERRCCMDSSFIHNWSTRRINLYLKALSTHLEYIHEGANLSSILDHSMYCGMSLGRIGLDFRCLLVPLFEEAIVDLFTRHIDNAKTVFWNMLDTYKWPRVGRDLKGTQVANDQPGGTGSGGGGQGGPPYSLMQHAPLAVLTNSILNAYNELRHCAPKNVADVLTEKLEQVLLEVVQMLKRYRIAEELDESERAAFKDLCVLYTGVAVPYILTSWSNIYPNNRHASDNAFAASIHL